MPPANGDSVLAFDVGLKRTGVAVGSRLSGAAQAETTISGARGQLDWAAVDQLLQRWQPTVCVIGDPHTSDPHLNKLIRRLTHYLQQRKIRVVTVDERLTSVKANEALAEHKLSTRRKVELRDQLAACLILESYLSDSVENN
jgi:putative Holliday junction resolvase